MRTIYAGLKTYRLERDAWEQAYYELSDKAERYRGTVESQLDELRRDLNDERVSWRSALRKARSPGLGVFAGAGYTGNGVGLVWKIF
jgi:hypothetical protein